MKTIDYYFWINSDWAYLGADRLEALRQRYAVQINYKPVDLINVYSRTGGIPLGQRAPERQAYREAELRRWISHLGIPINITPRHMCPDATMASCFVIAAEQAGHDMAPLYKAILQAQWCDEKDISDADVVMGVATELGLPANEIMEKSVAAEIETIYRRYTDEAVAAGVFGSPTYAFEGELFWGQDRLDFLEEAVAAVAPIKAA